MCTHRGSIDPAISSSKGVPGVRPEPRHALNKSTRCGQEPRTYSDHMDRRTLRRIGGPYDRPILYKKDYREQNVPSNGRRSSSSSSSSSNSNSSSSSSNNSSSSSSGTSTSNTLLKSETGFNRTGFNREVLPAYTAVSPLLKLAERRDCTTRRKLALASDSYIS